MIILFLRLAPWLTALAAFLLASWQWQAPLLFPWPLLALVVWQITAAGLIGYGRIAWRFIAAKMLPSIIAEMILCGAFLLVETPLEHWIVTILFAGIPLLSLELLFLLAYDPSRYPVNGLSRLNLALVPVSAFFLGATMSGLHVFLQYLPLWMVPTAFVVFGYLSYFLTTHPMADMAHTQRWAWIGALIGLQVGVLVLLLPVAMPVQGALAMLFFCLPLRVRRYAYQPVPPRPLAWAEGMAAAALFGLLLFTTHWA